ncbi:MAG: hypothetical protein ACTSXJ_11475 [Candidatus Baldrarchaeia archaeon]
MTRAPSLENSATPVRAGIGAIQELLEKYDKVSKIYPNLLKEKVILTLYVATATPDVVEEAKKKGVWMLKATEDLTPPPRF